MGRESHQQVAQQPRFATDEEAYYGMLQVALEDTRKFTFPQFRRAMGECLAENKTDDLVCAAVELAWDELRDNNQTMGQIADKARQFDRAGLAEVAGQCDAGLHSDPVCGAIYRERIDRLNTAYR